MKGASTRMRKEYLGTVKNRLECVLLVKGTRPTASGVTFKPSHKKCWAEFGTTGRTTESNYETCKFDRKFLFLIIPYVINFLLL